MPVIGQISVGDGATFTPSVNSAGELSWTNNKNLPNPATVDLAQAVIDTGILAPLNSPALTGTPTAPTPTKTDNSTKLATTAYVHAVAEDYLSLTGGSITGNLSVSGNITGNLTGNVTGNVTGTASGNLPLSGGTLTGAVNGVTPTAGDNSTKIATTEFVNTKAGNYLPLSGGTMTGSITMGAEYFKRSVDSASLTVCGATSHSNGAYISLNGKDRSINAGIFTITARDGAESSYLAGNPNGTLTWNGQNILTASNYNSYALPLNGGTMTGNLTMGTEYIKRSVDNASLTVCGGTSYSNGAYVSLCGKDRGADAGTFIITARDGAKSMFLMGRPDGTLTWDNQPLLPVGVVQAFAGTTIPTGWLLCDGSAVSRTTYANLFAVIGTTYGSGNGSTTFNLPNLTDRFIQGNSTVGTVKNAGLPNIKGNVAAIVNAVDTNYPIPTGAFYGTSGTARDMTSNWLGSTTNGSSFDASRSSSVYSDSVTTVQPPALTMKYIIKY